MFIFLAIIEIQKKKYIQKKKIQIEYNLIINKKKKIEIAYIFPYSFIIIMNMLHLNKH